MSGKRKKDLDLPARVHYKHGAYYWIDSGIWTRLGTDRDQAIEFGRHANSDGLILQTTEVTAGYDLSKSKETETTARANQVGLALRLHATAKRGASQRNLDFVLSVQDVLDLIIEADGRCMLTGIEFCNDRADGDRTASWKPSLDRIESRLGYLNGNVRLICIAANLALQERGDKVFAKLAEGFINLSKMATPTAGNADPERTDFGTN